MVAYDGRLWTVVPKSYSLSRTAVVESFGILPYVEGQKYTFGHTFGNGENEGEFVYWKHSLHSGDKVCEITCKTNKFWIYPLENARISINNKGMIIKKTQLKFGDKFSLVKQDEPDRSSGNANDSPNEFLFEIHFVDPNNEFDITIGQNVLILSHILSYLPHTDVKNARLVSQFWNAEASIILKKKSSICFNFTSYDPKKIKDTMKIFRFSQEMKTLAIPNWKISIPPTNNINKAAEIAKNPDSKFAIDINKLFGMEFHINAIKSLSLSGVIANVSEWGLQIQLLKKVAGTIQELKWDGIWTSRVAYYFPASIIFKRLDTFSFSCSTNSMNDPHGDLIISSISTRILKATRTISSIHIGYKDNLMYNTTLEGLNTYPSLESISLTVMDPGVIKSLLKLDKPLKKLCFGRFRNFGPTDVGLFEELLSIHSKSLESLSIYLGTVNRQEKKPFPVQFPSFPVLVELKIECEYFASEENNDKLGVVFSGEEGRGRGICVYEDHLPKIQSLTVLPYPASIYDSDKWEMFILDIFFPFHDSGQKCKTIRFLDIWSNGTNFLIFPSSRQIKAMFPNIVSAHVH